MAGTTDQGVLFDDLPAVPEEARLEVRSDVEFIELRPKRALNVNRSRHMPFAYTLNPARGCEFGCKYCYARYTHEYLGREGERAWDREILVKTTLVDALRSELRPDRLRGKEIAIGTATDPYQPAERRFGVMRSVLTEFARHRGLTVSITTKSPLVVRDVDLLQELGRRGEVTVNMSLISLDRRLLRRLEPRAPTPERRLWAVERLATAGVRVGMFLMPILPGLTDDPGDLEALIRRAADAGAQYVVPSTLFLRSAARKSFLPVIDGEFPALAPLYHDYYRRSAYAPKEYRMRIGALVRRLARKYGVGRGWERRSSAPAQPRMDESQLSLPL